MDTLTHGLSGMLVSRLLPGSTPAAGLSTRTRLVAGFLCGAFPDIDFVLRFEGLVTYLNLHRGVTHSILLAPIWALLLAYVFAWLSRGRYSRRDFYLLCWLSIVAHIAGDIITTYGTMLFALLSNFKLSWPTTFIIDFYFTGIIVLALLLAAIVKQRARQIAIAGAALLFSYIGLQGYLQHAAMQIAATQIAQQQWHDATANAIPQPLSPFNWKLIIQRENSYQVAYVNLWRKALLVSKQDDGWFSQVDALYRPRNAILWQTIPRFGGNDTLAKQIWQAEAMRDIRAFMLYPSSFVAEKIETNCSWFVDQRFVLGHLRQPFVFGGCREETNSRIRLYHWEPTGKRLIQ